MGYYFTTILKNMTFEEAIEKRRFWVIDRNRFERYIEEKAGSELL